MQLKNLLLGTVLALPLFTANGQVQDTDVVDAPITGEANFAVSKTLTGLKGFAGAQQALTSNLSLREEASYTGFKSFTENVPVVILSSVATTSMQISPRLVMLNLDLVYGFSL